MSRMRNPLRGLRFSLLDFHAARATAGTKIAMLGIALIPLIYGALYLMAFYDPYGNLDAIPVAVVNEDVAAYTADGQKVEAGKDLAEELKSSESLDYHFVSAAEAQAGLEDGTYYNKIVIPADFSKKIASADSDDPEQARLVLVTNDANNYLSSILGASVMRVVTAKTNYAVGENYYVQIFDKIEDTGASLKVASDGATELADGLVDAADGSKKITENLQTAQDGAGELAGGLKTARDGSATITSKLGEAKDGARQLADGTVSAADGSKQLAGGLKTARDGSVSLADGVASAKEGSATITTNLKAAASGAEALDGGVASLADGLKKGNVGAAELYAGLKTLELGTSQLAGGAATLQQTLTADVRAGSEPLTFYAGMSDLASGAQTLDYSVKAMVMGDGTSTNPGLKNTLGALGPTMGALNAGVSGLKGQLQGVETKAAALDPQSNPAGATAQLMANATAASLAAEEIKTATTSLPQTLTDGVGANIQQAGAVLAGEGADGGNLTAAATAAATAQGAAAQAQTSLDSVQSQLNALLADTSLTAEQKATVQAALNNVGSAKTSVQGAQSQATTAYTKLVADSGSVKADLASAGASLASAGTSLNGVQGSLGGLYAEDGAASRLNASLTGVESNLNDIKGSMTSVLADSKSLMANSEKLVGQAGALLGTLDVGKIQTGLDALASGTSSLSAGASRLKSQLDAGGDLNAGVSALAQGAKRADNGLVQQVLPGMQELSAGMSQLADGSLAASQGASALKVGLGQLYAGSEQLTDGLGTASTGASALKAGLGELYAGSETLASGLGSAKAGSATLASGLGQLQAGSATLTDGVAAAQTGSAKLEGGIGQLHEGSATLTEGLDSARSGSRELADGLSDGVEKVEASTQDADTKAAMMSEPISLEQEAYTEVENYGTGFAPYFIALGLWVGALVMTFLLKPLNSRLIASGATPGVAAFAGLVPWLIVGAVQGLLLGATIQFACGIDVLHPAAYYALIILSSAVFCAMIQAVTALLGFPGKFVCVVLLMLQLTTAAGTFPIQTEFQIFQAMSPYLPMTYIVHALRLAMRGIDLALVGHDVAMLVAFAGASFAVTCLVAHRKRLITMMDLHPLVDL